MAVAFHRHHVAELHRTVAGDPADVVASEVHEHDVLGPLLGVGHQLGGELLVLLIGLATRPCAGERAQCHPVALHSNHYLRR